jgi:urease accessory protein
MNIAVKRMLPWVVMLLPALALAHTGADAGTHHDGFLGGLLHPFTGLDHLAAMLAVGMWSALAVRPVWVAPLAFVVTLAAGAATGFARFAVPAVEPMIAASLLVIGLLVATRQGLPVVAAAALVALFAFFHGAAHGNELGGSGQWLALAGMLFATAALHLAGVALGHLVLARQVWVQRAAGAAVAVLGTVLLVQMF